MDRVLSLSNYVAATALQLVLAAIAGYIQANFGFKITLVKGFFFWLEITLTYILHSLSFQLYYARVIIFSVSKLLNF